MSRYKKKWMQAVSSVLLLAMITTSGPGTLQVQAAGETAKSDGAGRQSYDGEANAMDDDQYAEFGLVNNSPAEFDPNNTDHPLNGYEPTYISELYVADMDRTDKWKGSFRVMNNTDEVSKDAFNLNNMDDDLIGTEYSFNNLYPANKDKKEVQTHNACAIDVDGDGTDEILDITLYVDKTCADNPKNRSRADVSLYDLNEEKRWVRVSTLTYDLADSKTDDSCFVDGIEADTSKGYVSLSAWDIDGDGREEGAVYICSQTQERPYIIIVEGKGSLKDNTLKLSERKDLRISLSEMNSEGNNFTFDYKSWKMPVVSLATTRISGEEALVVNASHPFKTNDGYGDQGQCSAIKIFHYNAKTNKIECRYVDEKMTYGDKRMRFSTAVDADLNGNGVEELVIGGYKNTGWKKNSDKGNMDADKNLVQLIVWNSASRMYEKVWDSPKEVEPRSGLKISVEMLEPAAMTAGQLSSAGNQDYLFLEGVVLKYSGASTNGATEKELYQSGAFKKELSMELGGSHDAFISTAYAAKFSSDSKSHEQIVVLGGDHQKSDGDYIYYDICWIYESNGQLTSVVTNNNYIDHKNEDDNGTFICMCPLNVDEDTVYVDYMKKTYGWSAPVLYTVLQSPPYWSELTYNSETFGAGKVSYKISYGSGSGTEGDWGVGIGVNFEASLIGGGGLAGNNAMAGGGLELEGLGKYVGSYGKSHSISDSYEIALPPGEDQAIMMAVPVVTYHYALWVPEFTVTQADIDSYNEMREFAPDEPKAYTVYTLNKDTGEIDGGKSYRLGDVVPGHWEDSRVVSTLDPSFSHIPLEEYNELAEKYSDRGFKAVDDELFNEKKIGDPSSYPHSVAELYSSDNMGAVHVSKQSASVTIGEAEHTLSYEVEDETEISHGFNLEFEAGAYVMIKGEVSCFFSAEGEVKFGAKWDLEGGAAWVSTNSKGVEYSVSVIDLAEDATDDYKFTVQMAVFNATDLSESTDEIPVVGYIVTGIEAAPPGVPVDLRVLGTTEHEAVLQWDAPEGRRSAKSYEVFIEDNVGRAYSLGVTDHPYYLATKLDPAKTYRFAVKSYAKEYMKGASSVMSRWVTAITRDSTMYFTTQPKNVIVEPAGAAGQANEYALSAEAVVSGNPNAKLSYQWQKYDTNVLTEAGLWEDVAGAADSTFKLPITQENQGEYEGKTYYRAVATYKNGSNVKSVISKIATVFVSEAGTYHDLEMDLTMTADNLVYSDAGNYYVYKGKTTEKPAQFTIQLSNSQGGNKVPEGEDVYLMFNEVTSDGRQTMTRFGEAGTIQEDGTATFSIENVNPGVYELFAVYPGTGAAGVRSTGDYFLPAQSNTVVVHVTDGCQLEYHLDGGTNSSDNPSLLVHQGEAVSMKLENPTKNGYTFAGWYLDQDMTKSVGTEAADGGQTVELGPEDAVDGTIHLYAKWEQEPVPFQPTENDNEYQISSYEDLVNMAQMIQSNPEKYASATYIQTKNINCGEQSWNLPIGTEEHPFEGTYLGNDFYVLGLRQGSVQYGGLFGVIGENGSVKDLSVADFDYNGWSNVAGGIAGVNKGTIDSCGGGVNINSAATIFRDGKEVPITTLNSEVKGLICAGGIAGRNEGTIKNSHSNASVYSGTTAGGIVGENSGTILNVYNTGSVKGAKTAGGIAGTNVSEGSIQYGYNSTIVTVYSEAGAVGGIAGTSDNINILDFWYPSDMAQACGDQQNSAFASVGQKTDDEMSEPAFSEILNDQIQGTDGMGSWAWSASKNGGYPTIEYVLVGDSTLTLSAQDFGLRVSVKGKIHPGAKLKFVRLSEAHADYLAMKAAVNDEKFNEGWQLALLYEDGSYATWNGDLTVNIGVENKELLEKLKVLYRGKQAVFNELSLADQGESIEVKTDSLHHIGLWRGDSGESDLESGSSDKNETDIKPDNKPVNTGDDSYPMALWILMMASGTILIIIEGRKRIRRNGRYRIK